MEINYLSLHLLLVKSRFYGKIAHILVFYIVIKPQVFQRGELLESQMIFSTLLRLQYFYSIYKAKRFFNLLVLYIEYTLLTEQYGHQLTIFSVAYLCVTVTHAPPWYKEGRRDEIPPLGFRFFKAQRNKSSLIR